MATYNVTACTSPPVNTIGCPIQVDSSTVPVAKIVPPVLVGFILLLAIGVLLWRRFHRTNKSLTQKLLVTEHEVEKYRKAWHIAADEVQLHECIGRGAVGEVYRGVWRDMPVAVKTIKGAWMSSEEMEQELDHEASVLQAVRHAHVVQFFGAGTLGDGTPPSW